MDLTGILAITGKPGLYKLISQTKSGALVESLVDKKRMPAFAHERISSLKDITMFGNDEDKPLIDIFQNIYKIEDGKECISHKSSDKELKDYMEKVFPDYDKERVHLSDMKKLFSWYNILLSNNLIDLEQPQQEEEKQEEN
ncbi:MAG: DUF5606 domain-containing protein [Synergistales bacterium]|jgi:hypothetical protein|nr:DUF5606 domain-containing protein [Bacteroidales bacterium]MDY6434796.1 DUF5606 domain-containing protein [Synergistales bacterium]MBQ6754505.1 DUF5606 domain-containing protein [Bacteroidales bacterium]MDY6381607.1 DUF5606 domain-containing protein [Bacteroidales bacterium]MDY6394086.1 DUF5606 domain-containing protein [Bacteroidales bacterium]